MNTAYWCGPRWANRWTGIAGSLARVAAEYVERRLPAFTPELWNDGEDGGVRQHGTTSYDYACDRPDGRGAPPDLVPSGRCGCLDTCWRRVALVSWPGRDVHWYRQDRDGRWSHKPGGGPATNLDARGRAIADPRTCDRGPYTVFRGFYCLRPQGGASEGDTMNDATRAAPDAASVRLFLFAGRPDPEFALDDPAVADLLARLQQIQAESPAGAMDAVPPPPPQLGYRGLLVRLPAGEVERLLVYGGVISFRRQGRPHSWRDSAGIERHLLQEAARRGHEQLLQAVGVRVTAARS